MKKRIHSLLILILALSLSFYASAQTVGDYRSNNNNFNWNTDASWQRWDGDSWETPTGAQGYPGETAASIAGTVTIRNGHTVTANTDVTTNDIGNLILVGDATLTINDGIDIDVKGTLTMDGTSQITGNGSNRTLDVAGNFIIPATATNARIAGIQLTIEGATNVSGTLTLNNNNGTKTFKGRVTVSGSWTSTAITTNNRLVFGGEVITSGTFACGCN